MTVFEFVALNAVVTGATVVGATVAADAIVAHNHAKRQTTALNAMMDSLKSENPAAYAAVMQAAEKRHADNGPSAIDQLKGQLEAAKGQLNDFVKRHNEA